MKVKFLDDIERLRGFACILVLIQHVAWICPMYFIHNIIPSYLLNGGGGVHVFFAISGLVVTLSLRNKIDSLVGASFLDRLVSSRDWLISFYKKRFFRIFPVVFFVAILLGIFLNFTSSDLTWWGALFRSPFEIIFGMYNNSVELFVDSEGIHRGGFGPFWTLAVEAQFYVLWPLVLLLCRDNNMRVIVSLSLGVLFLYIIQPVLCAMYGEKYYRIYSNLSELFLGSFLAFLYQEDSVLTQSKKVVKLISIVLAIVIWFYPSSIDNSFFSSGIVTSSSSILIVALAVFANGSFNVPVLGRLFYFLGSRSFSFYAVQLTLANMVAWYTNSIYFPKEQLDKYDFYFYQFVIFIIVLLVLSELVYRFIEKPSKEWGRK